MNVLLPIEVYEAENLKKKLKTVNYELSLIESQIDYSEMGKYKDKKSYLDTMKLGNRHMKLCKLQSNLENFFVNLESKIRRRKFSKTVLV